MAYYNIINDRYPDVNNALRVICLFVVVVVVFVVFALLENKLQRFHEMDYGT